jgi:hypothetical protein
VACAAVPAEPIVFKPVTERIAGFVAAIDLLEAVDRSLAQVKHWFTAFRIGAVVDRIEPPSVCARYQRTLRRSPPHGTRAKDRRALVEAWRNTQVLSQFSQFS